MGGGTSGIQYLKGTNYSVSPNPATEIITVSTEKEVNGKIWISNLKGQEFLNQNISGNMVELDINELPSGVYFVNIENEGVVSSKKIVKK